ncbi:MAG: DUF5675 family protein [Acetobacteraceae bacterium]
MPVYTLPHRTLCFDEFQALGPAAITPTMYYQRGTEIVNEAGSTAKAVRGTLTVRNRTFDTIERAGGYVHLSASTTSYLCYMEESPSHNKRHQIRPVHTVHNSQNRLAAILIHSGNTPSDFVGCIGVGVKSAGGISNSRDSMIELFELLGGFKVGAQAWLQVSGDILET